MFATFAIKRHMLVPDPEKPGFYNAVTSKGVVSVQPDGHVEFRPVGTNGAFEEFYLADNRCVFPDVDGLCYDIPFEE